MLYAERDAYRKIKQQLEKLRGNKMKHVTQWLASLKGLLCLRLNDETTVECSWLHVVVVWWTMFRTRG